METVVEEQVTNETEGKSSFSFIHSNDDADSFIEIQLGLGDDDDKVGGDEELEMRISFSSALVALPDVFSMDESFDKLPPRSPLFSSSLSEWSFSSAETTSNSWSAPLSYQKKQRRNENRVRSPTMSSGKFSEMGHKPGRQIDASNSNYNYSEFAQSRGSSSSWCKCKNGRMVKGRQEGEGVIMKIWMKLRWKNLGALVEWLVKVKWEGGLSKKKKKSGVGVGVGVGDGFDRCLVQKERSGAKSCPVSSKASPLHREAKLLAGECSIQAAIAHCKRSYAEH